MKKTIIFLILWLSFFTVSAKLYSISATLSGTYEVPPNASIATGRLTGTFDEVSLVLNITVTFNGLIANATAAHIHKAVVGVNGPVQIPLVVPAAQSGTFSYSGTLTSLQAADLLAGLYYVNIHNASFPGGEIRGQLIATELEVFTSSNMSDFYGIGGYSYTEGDFPLSTSLGSPYLRSGPLPNNDFTFVATSPTGLFGFQNKLTTNSSNQPITLTFKGNNVRKMRAFVRPENTSGVPQNSAFITATATTNLGNTASITNFNSVINVSVGFRVLNENEYITQVVFSAPSNSLLFTTLDNIMIGDDNPQNVALNLDGVDDQVAIPSTVGNFAANASFTVSCWVKPATLQSDLVNTDVEILEKWNGTGSAYPFVIRYLNENIANSNAGNVGKIVAARYNGIANPYLTSSVSIDDNKWHHIAFVSDSQGLKLYIDGVLSASGSDFTPQEINTPCTNNSPLYIGSRNSINHFKGDIDEVRLWSVSKTQTEIQNEMFCKNPNTTNLQAAYNFNDGVPNGNNFLLSQVQDAVGSNHGTLSGFTQTGDASNFVTGQVKYVKANAPGGNDGSSWANAFTDLQSALVANTCNDLIEVYVARGAYTAVSNISTSFQIPGGMQIYGGFAGTETNINQRNLALIHTTNKTTLSGDLAGNDTPFNFASNRNDNSENVIEIIGGYVTFDGFTVSGGSNHGIYKQQYGEVKISNCRMIDNQSGLSLLLANSKISNCMVAGNNSHGIFMRDNSSIFRNCLIVNNGGRGIIQEITNYPQSDFINCTIASNGNSGMENLVLVVGGTVTNNIKNTIIKDNVSGGIANTGSGITTNNITYSLIQGQTITANGNLNGNTVNPQFVSPLANTIKSDAGDYRLKWCSLAIGAGTNTGISPLDLDRNPRNFNGIADMGAYEFLGNTPSQANNSTISGTIDSPIYGGAAIQTITSTAKIIAPAGAIDFKAPNSITLNPGFEARGVGKYFKAEIGANATCVN